MMFAERPITRAHEGEEHGWPSQYYAPYVYMARYPILKLSTMAENTGVRYFTLAFILTGHDNCKAAWFGTSNLNYFGLVDDLEQLREMGGDAIISFGGASGNELAEFCPDAESLAEQYQIVIDTLGITHLDFDIEGGREDNADSVDRRSEAIAMLQASAAEAGKELSVSFTLPVLTTGLTEGGMFLLRSAVEHGVDIDVVNIMTMNFEESAPPDEMGANTIQAVESLHAQLQTLYPDATEEELWSKIGVTPMIGVNDRAAQIFTQEDAQAVVDFALENKLKLIAMWALDRDQECEFEIDVAQNDCSTTEQEQFAYSMIFNQITTPAE
jgi:chitinase